jgi:hypothetical protein
MFAIEGGPRDAVFANVDYYDRDIVPLYLFEVPTSGFACVTPSTGRSAAHMLLYRAASSPRPCIFKVDKNRGANVVRCMSSSGHYGAKCPCCSEGLTWWNTTNPDRPAQLLSPSALPVSGERPETWFPGHGEWPSTIDPGSWNQPDWWKRSGNSTVTITAVAQPCYDDDLHHYEIGLYPRLSDDDTLIRHQADGVCTVWGAKFGKVVTVYQTVTEAHSRDSESDSDQPQAPEFASVTMWPGMSLGLFRYSQTDIFDSVMFYEYLRQAEVGKMTMQSFRDWKAAEYDAWKMEHADSRVDYPEFPSKQTFSKACHAFTKYLVECPSTLFDAHTHTHLLSSCGLVCTK